MGGIHEGHSMIPNKPPMGINVASDTKAGLRYADMIVDGHKTLESRNSDTLRPYVGKRVAIVRTGEGKAKAIGEVTVGEPKVVNQKQFRAMEDEHRVPKGSRFDINTPTKHLYPMHDPVRYEEERDVGHGIVSRQVIHKAGGGTVEPTVSQMLQELAKKGSKDDYFSVLEERDMSNPRYREQLEKQQGLEGSYPESFAAPIARGLSSAAKTAKAIFAPQKQTGQIMRNPIGWGIRVPNKRRFDEPYTYTLPPPAPYVPRAPEEIANQALKRLPERFKDAVIDKAPTHSALSANDLIELARMYKEKEKPQNKAKGGSVVKEPKNTVKAYKLFRVHKDHPGKLFPLFVDANTPVEMNKWVDAKEGEMKGNKVKSKIGDLAYRPGWHAGDLPIATHIGEKSDPSKTAPDRRPANHAWAEVEMPDDVDWQSEATKRGTNAQGKLVPVKAHITDQIPKGGHYRYKTNPNMTGNWLIGGSMKVNKVLSDAEVERINKKAGMADLPRTEPFAKKTFGFAQGGSASGLIAPDEFKAEEYVNYKAEGGKVEPTQEQMREALRQKMRYGMYSPLERMAVDVPRNKGTGAEFMAEISKQKGFKPEEVADRKIPIPEGKMTKLEFLKHLRQHSNPPLQEKILPDMGTGTEAREERAQDYYNSTFEDLSPEQQYDVRDWVRENNARFSQYQLPNGENYREMLLKLPALDIKDESRINYLQSEKRRTDPAEWAQSQDAKTLETLMDKARKFDKPYVSGHYRHHPNLLAHVRMSDREGANGEKLLHVEELQSDWHQNGRKRGYERPKEEVAQEMRKEHERLLQEHETKLKEKRNALFNEFKSIKNQLRSMPIGASDLATQLQARELDIAKEFKALDELQPPEMPNIRNDGVPNAPFKKSWHELGMKHVLHHAAKNGYDGVVITPGSEQAERWGDEGLKVHYDKKIPEFLNKFGKPHGVQVGTFPLETQGEARTQEEHRQALTDAGLDVTSYFHLPQEQRAKFDYKTKQIPLHYFPINDQMRTSILKEGMPQYMRGGVVHKAEGGAVLPIEIIKAQMADRFKGLSQLQSIGANEAPSLGVKAYVPTAGSPDANRMPVGGIDTSQGDLPVGGIDMSKQQAGHQLMPQGMDQPPQAGMEQGMGQMPTGDKMPMLGGMPEEPSANLNQGASNILSMTPQGQAMSAMRPQSLAKGGSAKSVADMKAELAAKKSIKDGTSTRIKIDAEGPGGVKGIVVPRHMWEGKTYKGEGGKKVEGMRDVNEARAKVYGSENRDPMSSGQMNSLHKKVLAEHFQKPIEEQTKAEEEALNRLREAKHIGKTANTLDKSEKLDTVNHETDSAGRNYVGFASKGVAGHSLYTSGHGENQKHHVINTCAGQTVGCGGGTDNKGIVDTSRGTCFAPNAESQYVNAAVRRASHEQAKHDPAMSKDWILAHTGSLRNAAENADKKNKVLLFRPNVVDETDVTSRHAIRHLNDQRKANGKPHIIANSYGKTNELHDPENGYYVTHSNVGPKVKKGASIEENIARDKARVRNTVMAADNKGDFKNEQGNKTPPKGSYLVTDVKRGSPLSKNMEAHITHAKYWTTGRPKSELTPEEISQGEEGHYGGDHKPTTEDNSHYGHKTVKGLRFDYQKQHVLHPRLVQVGKNDDGTPHMIPTDSRFKDEEVLNKQVKERYKTKNGKVAGHILMTTPTESTSSIGHQTSFTHHVNDSHIEHAKKNKGEYEIDKPEEQLKAAGKEYVAPQAVKFYAEGGTVGGRHIGFSDDDFHAFPEQNVIAQRHLAMRGHDKEPITKHSLSDHKRKVTMNKDMDTMLLELTRNKKAK